MDTLIKILQILFVLSPLFITGIALGLLLHKGIKLLRQHALYWLVLSMILFVAWIFAFADSTSSISTMMILGAYASSAYSIYLSKKKTKTKRG